MKALSEPAELVAVDGKVEEHQQCNQIEQEEEDSLAVFPSFYRNVMRPDDKNSPNAEENPLNCIKYEGKQA